VHVLKDFEIGVMFWAGGDPAATLRELGSMGVRCGQLGVPGDYDLVQLDDAVHAWRAAASSFDFQIYTVFAAYAGESYNDIPAVRRTVGFVPPETRAAREARTQEVSRFAHGLGVASVATHIGCVPEDRQDPEYAAVMESVRRICDFAAQFDQNFALETGQESAAVLLDFLHDVNRGNLGINFDPANMILYGTGDPIDALEVLRHHVLSVHCKDGTWPPGEPGAHGTKLGTERPLGKGDVDLAGFLARLRRIGYDGPLAVERESSDPVQRMNDIRAGIQLLKELQLSGY
jgi:L-ribulose-5-phosphate 3-epimerase